MGTDFKEDYAQRKETGLTTSYQYILHSTKQHVEQHTGITLKTLPKNTGSFHRYVIDTNP